MGKKTDAALRSIVMEFDVFTQAYDRYSCEMERALFRLDIETMDEALCLILGAIDTGKFLDRASPLIEWYRAAGR